MQSQRSLIYSKPSWASAKCPLLLLAAGYPSCPAIHWRTTEPSPRHRWTCGRALCFLNKSLSSDGQATHPPQKTSFGLILIGPSPQLRDDCILRTEEPISELSSVGGGSSSLRLLIAGCLQPITVVLPDPSLLIPDWPTTEPWILQKRVPLPHPLLC